MEKRSAGVHGVKLLRLMLRNFEHLHRQYSEAIFLKLLDDVANRVLGYCVWFDDSKSALQSLHSLVVCPWSFVFRLSPQPPLLLRLSRQFPRVTWRRECPRIPSP